ncbi:MAG TPA: MFS transporter [Solirubrobacteraceae bacterium]|nr:MFS transporter [Solirubrobacteraceae bacterium]
MSSYRALLARPGARAVALSCGLGWLSFSSYGLAIVLAVHSASGSFAVAGAAIGAFSAGSALLAPARGRFVDRRGPRTVALFAAPHAAALALLVAGCTASRSAPLLVASAALAGACVPPLIATARSLWPVVAGPRLARTGHAFNAVLGDLAQVAGPALTGVLAALASPLVALGVLVPGAAAGALVLARIAPLPVGRSVPPAAGSRVLGLLRDSTGLRILVACELALGLALGAIEVAAPVIAAGAGSPALAALPLALFAVGSVALSLWSGTGRARGTATARYLAGTVLLAAVLPVCVVVPTLPGISVVLLVGGAGFGLLTVALFELLDRVDAGARAVEALTWLTTAQGAGMAAGAAGAGALAGAGATSVLVLAALAGAIAAVVAWMGRSALHR